MAGWHRRRTVILPTFLAPRCNKYPRWLAGPSERLVITFPLAEIAAVNDRRYPAPELPIPKLTDKISSNFGNWKLRRGLRWELCGGSCRSIPIHECTPNQSAPSSMQSIRTGWRYLQATRGGIHFFCALIAMNGCLHPGSELSRSRLFLNLVWEGDIGSERAKFIL